MVRTLNTRPFSPLTAPCASASLAPPPTAPRPHHNPHPPPKRAPRASPACRRPFQTWTRDLQLGRRGLGSQTLRDEQGRAPPTPRDPVELGRQGRAPTAPRDPQQGHQLDRRGLGSQTLGSQTLRDAHQPLRPAPRPPPPAEQGRADPPPRPAVPSGRRPTGPPREPCDRGHRVEGRGSPPARKAPPSSTCSAPGPRHCIAARTGSRCGRPGDSRDRGGDRMALGPRGLSHALSGGDRGGACQQRAVERLSGLRSNG